MNESNFWFWLNVIANICQLESYEILLHDANNSDLLNYLKHQDNDLLEKIVKQNEEIISLLKGGKND